jgi:hypothetical protein
MYGEPEMGEASVSSWAPSGWVSVVVFSRVPQSGQKTSASFTGDPQYVQFKAVSPLWFAL